MVSARCNGAQLFIQVVQLMLVPEKRLVLESMELIVEEEVGSECPNQIRAHGPGDAPRLREPDVDQSEIENLAQITRTNAEEDSDNEGNYDGGRVDFEIDQPSSNRRHRAARECGSRRQ